MIPEPDVVSAGHAFYTPRSLAVYDLLILGYFSRLAWRCPASRLVGWYDQHVSDNHLDVGVGTGYFLDKCIYPSASPRLVLMDPNTACLDVAARRIARYEPESLQASVLDPIDVDGPKFDSIGLNHVLHCLPGNIREKAVAFEHLRSLAEPGAVVFGATLLSCGVDRNWYARAVMRSNNKRGIFSNAHDDLEGLEWSLREHFDDVTIEIVGCVALFAGSAGTRR